MTSSARSSTNRLRSLIPHAIEEIPDFFRPLTAPTEGENLLIHLIAEHGLNVFFTWDLQMSFAIYDEWCRKAAIGYTSNIYLIAKKRITLIYLTKEVFEHYKRKRATDEAFKKKSEQMSTNKKSEVGGPGTGISLHSAGSISARQHGDMLEKKLKRHPTREEMFRHLHTHGHDGQTFVDQRSAKIDAELTRRLEEMSTQSPDTSIDEDAVYLEVVPISSGEASSSRGPAYGPHELEELQRDHQRLQETLLKERMERQEQMRRDKMEHKEENREMQDRLARMEALLMQFLGIRPHVPPTPRPPLSPVTERSGPRSDDQLGHLTTDIIPSQSAHLDDHRLGHWTDPHREMPEDRHHLLVDHDEFMYVQRWHLVLVLLTEKELTRLLYFCWILLQAPVNDRRCLSLNSNRVATDSVFADRAESATYVVCR
ncbi:hypothetical protein Scep_010000 [Stephania cephalantha]|uniref:Uncharacterized protein n=1 Tax=Stephania cephalantha TaxID=152367 RepID=A0AAP0PEU1_9MAGN